ncbi:hypothetical protein JCM19233_4940 [Vibrio astriarenae]|nr:hypothetical protein JCM19233_4940 [Vibrio sp. C7]
MLNGAAPSCTGLDGELALNLAEKALDSMTTKQTVIVS